MRSARAPGTVSMHVVRTLSATVLPLSLPETKMDCGILVGLYKDGLKTIFAGVLTDGLLCNLSVKLGCLLMELLRLAILLRALDLESTAAAAVGSVSALLLKAADLGILRPDSVMPDADREELPTAAGTLAESPEISASA